MSKNISRISFIILSLLKKKFFLYFFINCTFLKFKKRNKKLINLFFSRKNRIIFSEVIDNSISGFALVITFIVVGIFLLFNKDYFGNETVAIIIQLINDFISK